jgi:hypothetical protein
MRRVIFGSSRFHITAVALRLRLLQPCEESVGWEPQSKVMRHFLQLANDI